jgi:(R,R)-butanediol dehydrogenase/meso-butanediol dehydrogenase/diacetyl reductase
MAMQVGLITGHEKIELKEFPVPVAEPGKAVVEISHCGICGTDLHAFHTGDPYNPAICGHEWAGTVSSVAKGAVGVREGDRVGVGVPPACGQCPECRGGDATHCTSVLMGMLGIGPFASPHGGFAPSLAVEITRLYPIHPKLSDEEAGLLEPATVAVHAVRRTPIKLGDSVVVLGAGPIGLLVLQCARAAGAGCAVMIEPAPDRARLAAELGATAVIDPKTEDVEARVKQECGPVGADVVFECAGIPTTIDQSVTLARRGGVVSLVGLAALPAQIAPGNWLVKEVRLVASLGYLHEEFDHTMQLVADGRLRLAPLHTRTIGLADLDGAFRSLLANEGDVKILVDPRLGA